MRYPSNEAKYNKKGIENVYQAHSEYRTHTEWQKKDKHTSTSQNKAIQYKAPIIINTAHLKPSTSYNSRMKILINMDISIIELHGYIKNINKI